MLETIDACQICGGKRYLGLAGIRIPKDERKASLGIPEDATSWYLCQDCFFIFQNPRLERNYMQDWYARSGFHMSDLEISQGQIWYTTIQLARFDPYLFFNGLRLAEMKGGTCLDFGCGIGAALNSLAQNGNEVWGVELDRREIEFGKKHFPKINFATDLAGIPADRRFDLILTHHAVEHLFDPNDFAAFAARVLKPDGTLMIVVPSWREANTLRAINGFALSDNSMFDHVSMAALLNKHGLHMFSYLYQNNDDWELAVLARRSPKRNVFATGVPEILAELYVNIPKRDGDRRAAGDAAPDPAIVKV
jgi:2-polyprenyl-3-methyl-5-hydroxy-6-metoxy-1,4-benzoquinol methylase